MLQAPKPFLSGVPPAKRYERKVILLIGIGWTLFDLVYFYWRKALGILPEKV